MKLFFITMLMLLINNCSAKVSEAKNELPYGLSKDGKTFFGKEVDAKVNFFLAIAFPKNFAAQKPIKEVGPQNPGNNPETILAHFKVYNKNNFDFIPPSINTPSQIQEQIEMNLNRLTILFEQNKITKYLEYFLKYINQPTNDTKRFDIINDIINEITNSTFINLQEQKAKEILKIGDIDYISIYNLDISNLFAIYDRRKFPVLVCKQSELDLYINSSQTYITKNEAGNDLFILGTFSVVLKDDNLVNATFIPLKNGTIGYIENAQFHEANQLYEKSLNAQAEITALRDLKNKLLGQHFVINFAKNTEHDINTKMAWSLMEKLKNTTDENKRKDISKRINNILLDKNVNDSSWVQREHLKEQEFQTLANQAEQALIAKLKTP